MEILDVVISFLPIIVTLIISVTGLWITYEFQAYNRGVLKDKLNKELFTEFNARYDKLNNSLVIIEAYYRDYERFKLLEIEDKELFNKLRLDVIDFFNLCAEEYYWQQKSRIDSKIWKSWHSGMNYWYNNVPAIKSLWKLELESVGSLSYYLDDNEEFFTSR